MSLPARPWHSLLSGSLTMRWPVREELSAEAPARHDDWPEGVDGWPSHLPSPPIQVHGLWLEITLSGMDLVSVQGC